MYSVLYLSDAKAGAIAEAFGRFPTWTDAMLEGSPNLPGSKRAIAMYSLPDHSNICNLDDAAQLLSLQLRPSAVVTRDYSRSRRWASRIFEMGQFTGIRWWSYYDPDWASIGMWNITDLHIEDVVPLTLDHPDLSAASRTIVRPIVRTRPRKTRL
jgi:hypothetical protein